MNFKALHTMIHQVKSWIRTTCGGKTVIFSEITRRFISWVSDDNLNRYFNEFCFRINRSQSKATIFNNLIAKMVVGEKNIKQN